MQNVETETREGEENDFTVIERSLDLFCCVSNAFHLQDTQGALLDQHGKVYNQNAATVAASRIDGLVDDNDEPVSKKTKVEHVQQHLVELDGASFDPVELDGTSFDDTPESNTDSVTSDADSDTSERTR